MIKKELIYSELRKDELEMLKKFVKYCEKTTDNKRVRKEFGQFSVVQPTGILINLTKHTRKFNSSTAAFFIRMMISELSGSGISGLSYEGRAERLSPDKALTGLFKFPEDIIDQIKKKIEKGLLKIVEKRTQRTTRMTYRYIKD